MAKAGDKKRLEQNKAHVVKLRTAILVANVRGAWHGCLGALVYWVLWVGVECCEPGILGVDLSVWCTLRLGFPHGDCPAW